MHPLASSDVSRLRDALRSAGFTYEGVADTLGPTAHAALSRNETTPGVRATRGGSPLETLTRLWPLQAQVSEKNAERALPGLVDPLCAAGILERSADTVRARVDLRPYADSDRDWWVVSDLTPGLDGTGSRVGPDHVLGVSSASTSLAQLTIRRPFGRALDLGTGCGVQSLHLDAHVDDIVATDVNERALAMTRLNAELNGTRFDVRDGSLFEPVRGELFDLVVTNPPFVISPATGERLVYRDSGLPGDEVVRRVVTEAPRHLNPGGWCQVLANWAHHAHEPWEQRLTGWLEGSGCDAWVVQREVADPAEYVELWLKDAGVHGAEDYVRRYDTWMSWFDEQGVEAVGFGWLNLRRTDRDVPVLRLEDWPYAVQQPLGDEVAAWADRTDFLEETSDMGLLR
ncbi:MAG TPA: class I SAM-dependent methyltransferase [Nocardioidaceae bacterium]|nr:class I SAM-dependent methyltransferase [Nocardioidaceae bacterium]